MWESGNCEGVFMKKYIIICSVVLVILGVLVFKAFIEPAIELKENGNITASVTNNPSPIVGVAEALNEAGELTYANEKEPIDLDNNNEE